MNLSRPFSRLILSIFPLVHFGHASNVSLVEFQGMLFSEMNSEVHHSSLINGAANADADADAANTNSFREFQGRYLREEDVPLPAQDLWNQVTQHGWDTMEAHANESHLAFHKNGLLKRRSLVEASNQLSAFPFLICSHSHGSNLTTGFERLEPLLSHVNDIHFGDVALVLNTDEKTCFHASLQVETAQRIREETSPSDPVVGDHNGKGEGMDYYTIAPMTDLMKIQYGTMDTVFEESWAPIPASENPADDANDWERTIRVGISAGHRMELATNEDAQAVAMNILHSIQSLNHGAAANNNRMLRTKGDDNDGRSSLSSMFSVTASVPKQDARLLRSSASSPPPSHWHRALELGLEADHACQNMFDMLVVNPHYGNQGFDIILNPPSPTDNNKLSEELKDNERIELANYNEDIESKNYNERIEQIDNDYSDGIEQSNNKNNNNSNSDMKNYNDGIEFPQPTGSVNNDVASTASNKHCVASLIMALSTHPLVLSVETEGPIEANDFESQWITQSGTVNKRPLRDLGIDGSNQVISIIDSGLDINHKFFGPTSTKVFDEWDHSQPKVVRYDHTTGDMIEPTGGHGTKVAGAAAGAANDGSDHKANGVAEGAKLHIYDIQKGSGGYKMPMANTFFESMHSTNVSPARIANGSWMTQYRPYPFSCKFFDEALHDNYQGDVYVASAGNGGLDNDTLTSKPRTVGNPASCKNTLAVGASQSHGDRVASGAHGKDYLAAFSSRGPTFDGRMKPDIVAPGASVLTSYAQKDGQTVQSYGSSFAAPVVAGNAALVRQYFEEGKHCGSSKCSIDPSGSLVKAVLLNSAQSLKQVQVTQTWLNKKMLEEVSDYDNNQGMGVVQLDKTLPIPGHNLIKAIIRNNAVIQNKEVVDFFVFTTPGKCVGQPYQHDFSATLAWYDPAGAISCAKCLVNDLDIMVHGLRQDGSLKGAKIFPNGNNIKDFDNNVERIRFHMKGNRRYRIRVKAANLASATTKFSLIISGCFREISNPAL